jgi:hypothetical protein
MNQPLTAAYEDGPARSGVVSDQDYEHKLDELDRLLNDPDSPMDPSKVWSLLAEVARHDCDEPVIAKAD